MNDLYAGIASRYDAERMDWYAATYGARLFERYAKPGKMLDAGCGTGTLALQAAAKGWKVVGVDRSASLVGKAREKDVEGKVRWEVGDLRTLELGETFDLVTCVGDVLNHLETIEEWGAVFRRFAAHLAAGGTLFFDVVTRLGLERMDSYTVHDRPDGAFLLGIVWEPKARRSTLKLTTFTPEGASGLWRRHSATIPEWGQEIAKIEGALREAGFGEIERPFGTAEDPETEERVAFACRRV